MKFAPAPQNLKEWIGVKAGLLPTPIVYSHFGFLLSKVVLEATDKGVFEAIGHGKKTIEEIAKKCSVNSKALRDVLGILASLKLVKTEGAYITLSATSKKWVLKDSPFSMYWLMMFDNRVCLKWMNHVGAWMESGKGLQYHDNFTEEEWMYYEKAMQATSSATSKEAVSKIPVPKGATRLLDIGGGPGSFAKALCSKYSELDGVVFDLPAAVESVGANTSYQHRRVMFRAGNVLTDDIGMEEYDVIVMANVAHHFTEEQNFLVSQKGYRALKKGGTFTILEVLRDDKMRNGGDVISAIGNFFFSLSSTSGLWNLSEIKSWLSTSGFVDLKKRGFLSLPGFVAISGRK